MSKAWVGFAVHKVLIFLFYLQLSLFFVYSTTLYRNTIRWVLQRSSSGLSRRAIICLHFKSMSSRFQRYRDIRRQYSDSDSIRDDQRTRVPAPRHTPPRRRDSVMDPEQLKAVIQAAAYSTFAEQAALNREREEALTNGINQLSNPTAASHIVAPEVNSIRYDEPLDAVKCFPEFSRIICFLETGGPRRPQYF